MRRTGFTLVEVMIATLVLVTACLVVLMLLPGALRSQQGSRYQMTAAAHAQSMMSAFYQHGLDLQELDLQFMAPRYGMNLRDELTQRRFLGPLGHFDLERVVANRQYGNYPVPLPIARRLDASNDEIRTILDGGGYIYYSDSSAGGRADDKLRQLNHDRNERGESSRLIWGVSGYAQAPLLPYNPWAVPHQELYPFPPQARSANIDRYFRGTTSFSWEKDGAPTQKRAGETHEGGILTGDIRVQSYRKVQQGTNFLVIDALINKYQGGTPSLAIAIRAMFPWISRKCAVIPTSGTAVGRAVSTRPTIGNGTPRTIRPAPGRNP